jgi:hypothetical protein
MTNKTWYQKSELKDKKPTLREIYPAALLIRRSSNLSMINCNSPLMSLSSLHQWIALILKKSSNSDIRGTAESFLVLFIPQTRLCILLLIKRINSMIQSTTLQIQLPRARTTLQPWASSTTKTKTSVRLTIIGWLRQKRFKTTYIFGTW